MEIIAIIPVDPKGGILREIEVKIIVKLNDEFLELEGNIRIKNTIYEAK